jgi:hypothetical protein
MPDTIIDNAATSRFEMHADGATAFVKYRRAPGVVTLLHAEVPAELEGQGLGSRLVRATLEAVRAEGAKVVPRCGFVAAFIRRNKEFQDLVE